MQFYAAGAAYMLTELALCVLALTSGGAGSQWRGLRPLVRGPIKTYMHQDRRAARKPPGPQHPSFWGWERATPARSAVVKGCPLPTASAPSAARDGQPERGTKRGDLPNDVERPERTIRPVRLRHPMAHFGVRRWAGAMSSNRRGEPVDVRGPSHTILIDAPWPQFWFNRPRRHHLGSTKSASTPRSAHWMSALWRF